MTTIEKTPVPKTSVNRIRKIVLKAAIDESHVYRIMHEMSEACPKLGREDIAGVVQVMIDAGEICISIDDEDWLTFFRCVQPGETADPEAIYFDALEAFTEVERRWEMVHGDLTEPEKHLLSIMRKISRSGIVRLNDLSEALQAHNLTVEAVWPTLELLADRHEMIFQRRIGTSELYIELQNVRVDLVNRHIALPELKAFLDMNQRVEDRPRAFVLSKSLAAIGQTLSPEECTLLDAAQTLNAMFHRGGGVRETILHRVLQEYHNMDRAVRNQIIASLAERGFLKRTVEDRTKIMRSVFRFMGPANIGPETENPGIGQLIVKPEPVEAPACGCCDAVAV